LIIYVPICLEGGCLLRQIVPLLVSWIFTVSVVFSQETLSGIQRDLERVEREIKREKKLHTLELKKEKEFKKRKKEKMAALKSQSIKMDEKIAALKIKLEQVNKQKAGMKNRIKRYQIKRDKIAAHIVKSIDSLKIFFQSDFPYQKDKRLADLTDLAKDIKEKVVGPEEGMNRLFTILQSAISAGYDSEVYSGAYQSTTGKNSEGKYLRLGAVIQAFVSLDGQTVAYLVKSDSAYQWVDTNLQMALRQNIKTAVKIAEGKSAPELVLMPLQVSGYKDGEVIAE
jgi:hypothetical protein